ncbi:FAD:protein FMN transferase [uncultured Pseudoteredinibacter sp.]|uniref:FAD:protein FMN transferase n=1 Tax=uncultured Pseudoteredinibacter sp. TaxID=1641701 RepID=UPI002623EF48|nr:FAD:protein FMN transferase [uncultured Pseudoteredinibacter sp.]
MKALSKVVTAYRKRPALLAFFCLGTAVFLSGCSQKVEPWRFSGPTMGTQYNVAVVPPKGERNESFSCDQTELAKRIENSLALTNQQMSHYIADSELSKLSAMAAGESAQLSADMEKVLRLSERLYKLSDGAFDITIGPLVNLWGFGPKSSPEDAVPSQEQIADAMALSGGDSLEISGSSLKKGKAVELNLSAVAKGYGADKVAEALESCGAFNYLVEVGGELMLKGMSHRGTPWKIAVEKPSSSLAGQSMQRLIAVSDKGVATSGDYRNYFEKEGVRYSHTIDPRTGRPITHALASVTVLAPSSAEADAWATVITVAGPEQGMALAEQENLAVFMLVKTNSGFKEKYSSAFATYVQ